MVTQRALVVVVLSLTFIQAAYAADATKPPDPAPAAKADLKSSPDAKSADSKPAAIDTKAAPAAAPAGPAPQTSDEAFDVRVKSLEEQVNDIKEKIFRTKARLLLLQETVVGGDIVSGARAVIIHKNEMGSNFLLTSAAYALDGSPIYTKVDVNGDLAEKDAIEIFNGRIVPGRHNLTIKLEYKGHGFGPISYLEGYGFKVTSTCEFAAEGGKATIVQAIGYEKGGPFAEMKDKPDVKCESTVQKDSAKDAQPADKTADAKPDADKATP